VHKEIIFPVVWWKDRLWVCAHVCVDIHIDKRTQANTLAIHQKALDLVSAREHHPFMTDSESTVYSIIKSSQYFKCSIQQAFRNVIIRAGHGCIRQ
jgi:hypothetical protein